MADYKLGKRCKVSLARNKKRKNWNGFEGEVIQNNKRYFTLQNSEGLRESFLKIDFVIGEYKIETL